MAPTLTVAVQQLARTQLTLTWPGIQAATVQRLDLDSIWRNVRNAEPIVCLGSCAFYDHEAPLDASLTYRATSAQGTGTTITDAFGRTVSNGWGTADTGQTYTTSGGASSDYSVGSGIGSHSNTSVNVSRKTLIGSAIPGGDVIVTAKPTVVATGAPIDTQVITRFIDASNYYYAGARWNIDSTVTALVGKVVVGANTVIATTTVSGFTYVAGSSAWIKLTAVGSTLSLKVWSTAVSEPPWQTITIDTALPAAGQVGCRTLLNTSNTNTLPVAPTFDNLTVNSSAPLTVTSNPIMVPSGGQAWLTHPGFPAYTGGVVINDLVESYSQRRGLFHAIGAALPVAVSDIRDGAVGTLTIQTSAAVDITRLRNMFGNGQPALLRLPASWGGDTWYISIDTIGVDRFTRIATDGWRRWTLPFTRVDRPSGTSGGAIGITWNDAIATYATWNALIAAKTTWTALNQSVI